MKKAFRIIGYIVLGATVVVVSGFGALEVWGGRGWKDDPQIYVMKFGVTITKFMVLNNRLHLVVPLPVTGESGQVIEVDQMAKKARKGR